MADTLPSVYMTRHMLQQVFISGTFLLFFALQNIFSEFPGYFGILFRTKNVKNLAEKNPCEHTVAFFLLVGILSRALYIMLQNFSTYVLAYTVHTVLSSSKFVRCA